MLKSYRTVKQEGSAEITVDKSVFIGYAAPAVTEEEALAFIAQIRKKHRDATHNVPAYIIGEHNEIQRANDDGEPSSTAGAPILDVLKKEELRNTVVVITRYFGGIKLGTGGLVRAYTKSAKAALEAAQIITKTLYRVLEITVDYSLLGLIQKQLHNGGWLIKDTLYDELVYLSVWVIAEETSDFCMRVIEWTNGRCQITEGCWEYR